MFNVLGPLINPARPKGMVLGVAERHLGPTFAQSLKDGGVQRALVVCGAEDLDEISCAGETYAWELQDGNITERIIHPRDFGLSTHTLDGVKGASPQENAKTFKTLLTSADQVPERLKPVFDFVIVNAAALIYVAGLAANFEEAAGLARKSIVSGEAWKAFVIFRDQGLDLKA
jgi:anthranilate phosphoribosyltransferase